MADRPTYEVLEEALRLISRPRGWCKRAMERNRSKTFIAYCSVGAIYATGCTNREKRRAQQALCDANGLRSSDLARWNDWPRRSQKQVIAAFEKAIAQSRAETVVATEEDLAVSGD